MTRDFNLGYRSVPMQEPSPSGLSSDARTKHYRTLSVTQSGNTRCALRPGLDGPYALASRDPSHPFIQPFESMNLLIVLTSHATLGNSGRPTGFWLEELAAPYYVFKDAGAAVTLASPLGGKPPLDPKSDDPSAQTEATRRFMADPAAQTVLTNTVPLRAISPGDFDAVFYPGGHGPLWDLSENAYSIALIESMLAAGKPVAAVCHAPAALFRVTAHDGKPSVAGKAVTGFTDSEEEAAGLTDVVPFLVEDMLTSQGGTFSRAPDWQSHVVTDGLLITGQNPASSAPAAKALLALLGESR